MKVIDVSFSYDDFIKTEEELLQQHYVTVGWAEALQRKGVQVIVVKRFKRSNYFIINEVEYYFVKDELAGSLKPWQLPYNVLKQVVTLDADIVHTHSFPCSLQAFALRFLLKKKTGMVIQNHGGKFERGISVMIHKYMSHVTDAFFFTARAQGKHWFKSNRLLKKIMPVMEGGTFFNFETRDGNRFSGYTNRDDARLQSKISGDPVFLWVGRLDDNKDPLTILRGFEILLKTNTNASLYMIYSEHKLLNEVQQKISNSESLKSHVHLLGKLPHASLELYYNSADYFVLGSHYEGSGFALSEALKCGCIPIVTDIPSFRMMTDEGKLGAIWKVGDENSFVNAIYKAIQKPLREEAINCIGFFEKNLSFDAIASVAILHYQKIINSRNSK